MVKLRDNPLASQPMSFQIGIVAHAISDGVRLGDPVVLSEDLATQKLAFLGISGSGKTYAAGKTVELLLSARRQVVIIDTVGNWWGLRLAANGKAAGEQVPVLGGDHGDIALDSGHGRLVAETIVDTGASMVVDISDFTGGETRKFVTELATVLLAAKKRSLSPLMIVWEECQEIVPQKVFGEDAKMVGAVQKLIKKGRNYGVGTMLISQRPAAVNKEALWQCHTMLGFRLIGKHDRKAVEDWITDHGAAPPDTAMSELETGTCVLWSPQWLKRRDVVKIGAKWTFDASATPDFTDQGGTIAKLAPVDLAKFKATMAEAIRKADERDPDKLLAEIVDLKRKLEATDTGAVKPTDPVFVAELEQRRRDLVEEIVRLRDIIRDLTANIADFEQGLADESLKLRDKIKTISDRASSADHLLNTIDHPIAVTRGADNSLRPAASTGVRAPTPLGVGPGNPTLSKMARAFLTVLAQNETAFPSGMPRAKVLAYADYARSGDTGRTFAELIQSEYITKVGTNVVITAGGARALGKYTPLPVGNAFYEHVLAGCSAMARKILAAIHAQYPRDTSRARALEVAGYSRSGDTGATFAWLIERDYIIKVGAGLVRASDHLFDPHKRRRT